METLQTEALVIGSGPGGYVCGIRLGQLGKKTIVVEKGDVGGVCLNVGCIPSKALITASKLYEKAKHGGETMGIFASDVRVDVARLQAWKGEVVGKLTGGVKQLLKAAGAQVVIGSATLVAPNRVEVKRPDGETLAIEAQHIVLATGSRPIELPGFAVDQKHVLDSTGGLDLDHIPPRLVVIGGGYIGLELGTLYAKLGSKVTVVEGTAQLLPGTDPDLVQVVQRKLKKKGVEIHLETFAQSWQEKDGALEVRVKSKAGAETTLAADKILLTVGRRPNSENLGLERVGVRVERGFVVVDRQQRTSVRSIFAIGDLCGQPMLAHKASREAEVVAEVIAGHKAEMDAVTIPAVIFTDPEIAYAGLQQPEAEQKGRKLKVGKYNLGAHGRALAMAEAEGFVKVIADAANDEVLGVSIVGPEASDLISEAALGLEMGAFLPDLALTVHPHPTMGEAVMEAAKAALGESPHVVGGGQRR
jgi:dihydrolipoamide dehydrogenase